MSGTVLHQTLCRHFAELLSYPAATTRAAADACAERLRHEHPEASERFDDFLCFLNSHPAARIEEIYTATFDLQPACHPYVGYQLCGESQKRALFLMQLQQLYRQHGFAAEGDLPDHLATLLRFIAGLDDQRCREELLRDGLLPAIDLMLAQAAAATNPYIQLLQVVQMTLAGSVAATAVPPSESRRKEVCS